MITTLLAGIGLCALAYAALTRYGHYQKNRMLAVRYRLGWDEAPNMVTQFMLEHSEAGEFGLEPLPLDASITTAIQWAEARRSREIVARSLAEQQGQIKVAMLFMYQESFYAGVLDRLTGADPRF